jgi:hypothetical protein
MKSSSEIILKFILSEYYHFKFNFFKSCVRLSFNDVIMGSIPMVRSDLFSKKDLYYAILHLYLQQPGIIKMFLL